LESINFEDGACFDMNDVNAKKVFEQNRKELSIRKVIYKDGRRISSQVFNSDLNKEKSDSKDYIIVD
jgi:hypothetical protein